MRPAYDVTYRNMWPSDLLNQRIEHGVTSLGQPATCHAWFDRDHGALSLRIQAIAGGSAHEATRRLGPHADHSMVCAAIDAAFRELARLLPRRALHAA